MRILVTGANGFAGRHLLAELRAAGHDLLLHGVPAPPPTPGDTWHDTDLRDADGLDRLVRDLHPDGCIHLAAFAFVPAADRDPSAAFAINTVGTAHLLSAFRRHAPAARILVVSTSQVYGPADSDTPVTEDHPLRPHTFYAVSKAAADQAARLYADQFGMAVLSARPCNHIGPGQSPRYVSSAFSRQLIAIGRGETDPIIRVGNLESERDFLDVRDVARAYRLLVERGQPGQAYNIAAGAPVRIQTVLDELCRLAGVTPERVVDPTLWRPTDASAVLDTTRIRDHVGWTPRIPPSQTLRDILDDVRAGAG